jgi:hypothetical protein
MGGMGRQGMSDFRQVYTRGSEDRGRQSMSDFKQPFGTDRPAGGQAPRPAGTSSYRRPPSGLVDEGAETPMPGREKEYEDYQKLQAKLAKEGGKDAAPINDMRSSYQPPIDVFHVGEETPMPGREEEYEAYKAQEAAGDDAPTPAAPLPPLDASRISRSPGIQHNFYSTPTDEFKKPYNGASRRRNQ